MCFRPFLILWACLFFLRQEYLQAQLSGIVNTYVKVIAVDYACNKITVNDITGFSAGDKVLLIQMQGATIDQTNSINFGNITAINDAGNYEFAFIDHFIGNDVYFQQTLLKTYTPSGSVQMISVPQYGNITVTGELHAQPWNGNTGGVIVLECSGTLTLNANIDASEEGFRGGDKSLNGGDCFTSSNATHYYAYPTVQAGKKGEGICAYILGRESGRAKNSIGGGGGNSHNTGGGGGGNYGTGGRGGDKKNTGCGGAPSPFGYGALGLGNTFYNTALNKIFMGGGGGGGQANNFLSYDAGAGGGIVIIKTSVLNSNGYLIKSNGGSVRSYYTSPAGDNGDGNSGGGAGGTILLEVLNYTQATITETYGGKGGDTGYLNFDFGPGGGGGGGVVWMAPSGTAGLVATNVSGGNAGISGSGGGQGSGTSWNATNGTAGAVLNNLAIPSSTTPSSCVLPLSLLFFKATYTGRYHVQLNWATSIEKNNAFFTLEKSTDGVNFNLLEKVDGKAKSNTIKNYTYTDEIASPQIIYYRLLQTDTDGTSTNLGIQSAYPETNIKLIENVYPNPFDETLTVDLAIDQNPLIQNVYFINSLGELFFVPINQEQKWLQIKTATLNSGMYTLVIELKEKLEYFKVVKNNH